MGKIPWSLLHPCSPSKRVVPLHIFSLSPYPIYHQLTNSTCLSVCKYLVDVNKDDLSPSCNISRPNHKLVLFPKPICQIWVISQWFLRYSTFYHLRLSSIGLVFIWDLYMSNVTKGYCETLYHPCIIYDRPCYRPCITPCLSRQADRRLMSGTLLCVQVTNEEKT